MTGCLIHVDIADPQVGTIIATSPANNLGQASGTDVDDLGIGTCVLYSPCNTACISRYSSLTVTLYNLCVVPELDPHVDLGWRLFLAIDYRALFQLK